MPCGNNTHNPVRYHDPSMFVVVAGSTLIDQADRHTKEYLLQQIIAHKAYNASSLENDIALLFLNGYVSWQSRAVRAIPLSTKALTEGTTCLINGWAAPHCLSPEGGQIGVAAAGTSTHTEQEPLPRHLHAAGVPAVRRLHAGRHRCLPGRLWRSPNLRWPIGRHHLVGCGLRGSWLPRRLHQCLALCRLDTNNERDSGLLQVLGNGLCRSDKRCPTHLVAGLGISAYRYRLLRLLIMSSDERCPANIIIIKSSNLCLFCHLII
ncbi:uncharacterized protein LOC117900471 isoform X3 [Drosophila subobscura]|uniref:uncharacterized protein LOC117900471 isoform X3 n=1 Tax=Drosophila subobscura TaxID=7241 RepID=UPI00155AEEAC|nr:uncharacterized protein LOC117900471 isoform X3 [Drosophila subobscura]